MGVLWTKPGVQFAQIAPGGFRILAALDAVARAAPFDLVITCGTDGHPPTDPHTLGKAYDVRTHDLTEDQKTALVRDVLLALQTDATDAPVETSGGLATKTFFGWIEHPGELTEHCHVQVRKGITFP